MRLVLLSDTHGLHKDVQVPAGDVLLHAGDFSNRGKFFEVLEAANWLRSLPHTHKIVIAGNHDLLLEKDPSLGQSLFNDLTYLQDSGVDVPGLGFVYGSPWQPEFWGAFNLPRGAALKSRWDRIPAETKVLITHGPPAGHGDLTLDGEHAGCKDLLTAVQRVQPILHVYGHIHEGFGSTYCGVTQCVNAAVCDIRYKPIQGPVVIDL